MERHHQAAIEKFVNRYKEPAMIAIFWRVAAHGFAALMRILI